MTDRYGADAMHLYEMFMGPLEAVKPWQTAGLEGVARFLDRTLRVFADEESGACLASTPLPDEMERAPHKTIKKVTGDLDGMRLNTAIAAMMEFTNLMTKRPKRPRQVLETFYPLLAPFTPHGMINFVGG